MIWHNIKITIRTLLKDKLNSIINIFGLAIGIAAVLLIAIYVEHELSYDKFNLKHDRIYRTYTHVEQENNDKYFPICIRLTKDNFANQLPEIEEITQLYDLGYLHLQVNDQKFRNIKSFYVDTNFHKVFTFDRIQSQNPDQLFTNKNSAVITEKTAKKMFNTVHAVGKEFIRSGDVFTVTTVVKDFPKTCHFSFDILLPITYSDYFNTMSSLEYHSYILLRKDVDHTKALQKINTFHTQKINEQFKQFSIKASACSQKLTDIHLKSVYNTLLSEKGNINSVYIQILLTIIILLIGIINFSNIITVQFESKLNEIGVQKAIGASKAHIISKIFTSTFTLVSIATLIGMILSEIFLASFSRLVSRELTIDYIHNPYLLLGILCLIVSIGLLTGIYPLLIIGKYSPAAIIKGNTRKTYKNNLLTQVLVTFQFVAVTVLFASVLIVQKQINFMKQGNLGFQPDQVIAINNLSSKQVKSYSAIKQELLKIPGITMVSSSAHLPGGNCSGQFIRMANQTKEHNKLINEYRVSPGFCKLMDIQVWQGDEFQDFQEADKHSILLNQKALELLNIKDAVGRKVSYHGRTYTIKGVVKDFHYESLSQEIKPLILSNTEQVRNILIKVNQPNYKTILNQIKQTLTRVDNSKGMNYMLINDICRDRYQKEEKEEAVMISSSILSVLLALLGLYAMTLFITRKRTKEIGIRKVLGASIPQIIRLLFSTYAKWLFIAYLIAIPGIWFFMNQWLERFAYKISIGPLPFLFAIIATFLFAFLTVAVQTWKAARQNPIEALRYE